MKEQRLQIAHGTPAALARRTVRRVLAAWNLRSRDQIDDVLMVTTELVQNVVQHTDDGGELRLTLRSDAILIEVRDTCPHLPAAGPPQTHTARGRGLLLVGAIARRWGARPAAWAGRAGKVVWAELALVPAPAPAT